MPSARPPRRRALSKRDRASRGAAAGGETRLPQGLEGDPRRGSSPGRAGGGGRARAARLGHHESDERDHCEREREAAREVVVSRVGSLGGRSRPGVSEEENPEEEAGRRGPRVRAHVRARTRRNLPPAARAGETRDTRRKHARRREGDAKASGLSTFSSLFETWRQGPAERRPRPPARRAASPRRRSRPSSPPRDARHGGVRPRCAAPGTRPRA